jgi:ferric-dicitrate binding protein FerR (iron transport regulator)
MTGMKVMKMERMRGMDMMMNGNASGTVSVFGSISKIEGNRFMVKDNGAVERVVVSESATRIMTATGETSLANLKVGQTVEVHGMTAETGALTAKMVRIFP